MKKLLLISFMLPGLQTFSFSPSHKQLTKIAYSFPQNLNAMGIQEFLMLTPKRYQELTGKKMSFKQRIAYAILKAKLKRQLAEEIAAPHKTDLGLLSLIFAGSAWVFAFIPAIGVVSIPLAIAAIILGIIGLGRKKGDTKSLIGLILGSVFLLLILVAISVFVSGGWY